LLELFGFIGLPGVAVAGWDAKVRQDLQDLQDLQDIFSGFRMKPKKPNSPLAERNAGLGVA